MGRGNRSAGTELHMGAAAASHVVKNRDAKSRWVRILIGFGVFVVAAVIYFWFYGPQTGMALVARYKIGKVPGVWKTPVPLTDQSVSNIAHKKVSYFGYELELPWDDVDEQKEKIVNTIHVTYFHSGNGFWFSTFPPKNFLDELQKSAKLDPGMVRQVFGDEVVQSDYAFFKQMLALTPQSVRPFMPRNRAVADSILLLIKAIAPPDHDSGIFYIQASGSQGFQFNDPRSRPKKVVDNLYSNDGGVELIFFLKTDASAPGISQAEINRVVQSVQKLGVANGAFSAMATKK